MEYVKAINQNTFEISSKTDSYLLGLWYNDEKIRIVILKNEEKYERLYSKEDLLLNQSITEDTVNDIKRIIELHPEKVEISSNNNQITVKIKQNNEPNISFTDIPIKIQQIPVQQHQPLNMTIETKKEEIDLKTLNVLCEYLNKLNITISSMEKSLNILSNQFASVEETNDSIQQKESVENIMTNASNLEKKLQNIETKVFQMK